MVTSNEHFEEVASGWPPTRNSSLVRLPVRESMLALARSLASARRPTGESKRPSRSLCSLAARLMAAAVAPARVK